MSSAGKKGQENSKEKDGIDSAQLITKIAAAVSGIVTGDLTTEYYV